MLLQYKRSADVIALIRLMVVEQANSHYYAIIQQVTFLNSNFSVLSMKIRLGSGVEDRDPRVFPVFRAGNFTE